MGDDAPAPLIDRLAAALEHMRVCGECAENSWDCCEEGRKAQAALDEYNRSRQ